MNVRRICWDCPDAPVREWRVISEGTTREGHLIRISCPECKKEARVFGWMIGCECNSCKSQVIGAAK
jgi:ribosomal protein S27E